MLGPVALALLPEGQTGCYNLWLRESGVQRLVQHGSLSAWASVAPDSQSAPLAVGPGTPRLIVDGDSVMANPGMRDLILSYLGDVTFAPEGYNQATGGHTVVDMLAGAQAVVDQIVPGETIVIACHGGVINAYLAEVLGLVPDMFFRPYHASSHRMLFGQGRRVIETLNEDSYLAAEGLLTH